jgi:prevent-host-death family protein
MHVQRCGVKESGLTVVVNIHEAKTHLSKLLKRVVAGEEIVIAKSGQPIARLLPYETPQVERQPGSAKGKIWMADDFNAPLPPDILNAFEGK